MLCPWRSPTGKSRCRAHCLSRRWGRSEKPHKSMEKGGQRLRNEVMEGTGDKIREQATLRSVRNPLSLVQSGEWNY